MVTDGQRSSTSGTWANGAMSLVESKTTVARGRRVLLIDDDRWVRALFSDILTAMGFEVEAAASGEEGLALFGRGGHHLVITDLEMGGVSGLEVAAAVRQRAASVPVIVISGSAHRLGELSQTPRGFPVLTKPVRVSDFEAAVLRALGAPDRDPTGG